MLRIGIVFVVAGLGALWYQTLRSIDEGHWVGVSLWDILDAIGGGRPYSGWTALDQALLELLRLPPTLILTVVGLALIALDGLRRRRQGRQANLALAQIQKEALERRARLNEEANQLKLGRRLHQIRHKVA